MTQLIISLLKYHQTVVNTPALTIQVMVLTLLAIQHRRLTLILDSHGFLLVQTPKMQLHALDTMGKV
ncbi:hypothetical protein OSG_eHP19_00005 [environmental Halophage eHP-19]|nr:hypothetical protein OSG_eHP19_00005 [environmental Halophage eHP-19]